MTIESYQNKTPSIAENVFIHPSALVLGDTIIGAESSIWPGAIIRGDVNSISIGNKTNVQDGAVLHCTHDGPFTPGGFPLIIENSVTIGHKACLHAATIKDYCLIGIGAIILDGAIINSYSLIGAGSLVPPGKVLDSGYLWLGNPVKQIRPLTTKEKEHIEYSAEHYVRLKNSHQRL